MLIGALIVTICGCQSTPNRAGGERGGEDPAALLTQAERLGTSPRADRLRLDAADLLLQQGLNQQARETLADVRPETLERSYRDLYQRLMARLAYAEGDPALAETFIQQVSRREAEDYALTADICEALKQYQCAADGLIQYAQLKSFESDDLTVVDNDRIWRLLNRARSAPVAFVHRYHHAWWLLQQQIRQAGSVSAQASAWQAWRKQYPSHPANLNPPAQLLALKDFRPPSLAVLLPLSGSLASAGKAVRDGLLAGYLADGTGNRAAVRFYDTAAAQLGQVWEQVIGDGSEVIVGPLLKRDVEAWAELSRFANVPRLTLNYLDDASAQPDANAPYQIGIAIEDEAVSLANAMLIHGHQEVAIVHGAENWAQRAASAFSAQWPYPAASAQFSDVKELTAAVGRAMLVSESEARRRQIADIIGKQVEFLPRAREDLEAIVAFTSGVESRALVPALRFHFGEHLPVYATSQAIRQGVRPELEGFYLTEMPLFVETATQPAAMREAFALADNSLAELYALGFDAYRVATWLPAIPVNADLTVPGASGFIWLDARGRFHRELDLAQIKEGQPVLAP